MKSFQSIIRSFQIMKIASQSVSLEMEHKLLATKEISD